MNNIEKFKDKSIIFIYILTLLSICFGSFGSSAFNNYNITVYLTCFCCIFIFFYKNLIIKRICGRFLFPIILLLILFCISNLLGENLKYENLWDRYFSIFICIVFGFFSYILISYNKMDFQHIVGVLALGGILHVLVLLYLWYSLESPVEYPWVTGLPFFNNIRNFSDFIVICFLCCIYLFFIKRNYEKLFWGLGTLLIMCCVFWSGSRSSLVGLGAGLMMMIIFIENKKINIFLMILIMITSFLMSTMYSVKDSMLGFYKAFERSLTSDVNAMTSFRVDLYKKIFEYILNRPGFGYGGEAVRNYIVDINGFSLAQAHNLILQILLEFGFVGLLSFFWVLITLLKSIKYNNINYKNIILYAVILHLIVSSFFNGGFYYVSTLSLFCLFFSCFLIENIDRGEKVSD